MIESFLVDKLRGWRENCLINTFQITAARKFIDIYCPDDYGLVKHRLGQDISMVYSVADCIIRIGADSIIMTRGTDKYTYSRYNLPTCLADLSNWLIKRVQSSQVITVRSVIESYACDVSWSGDCCSISIDEDNYEIVATIGENLTDVELRTQDNKVVTAVRNISTSASADVCKQIGHFCDMVSKMKPGNSESDSSTNPTESTGHSQSNTQTTSVFTAEGSKRKVRITEVFTREIELSGSPQEIQQQAIALCAEHPGTLPNGFERTKLTMDYI